MSQLPSCATTQCTSLSDLLHIVAPDSVGILFAGFCCLPFTLGPGANLLGIAVVALYCLVVLPSKMDPEMMKIECRQNMFLNHKWRHVVDHLHRSMSPSDLAGVANATLLADPAAVAQSPQTVVTAPVTIRASTAAPAAAATTRGAALQSRRHGAVVERVCVAPGDLVEPGQTLVEIRDRRPPMSAASKDTMGKRAVFDALDLDGSGELSKDELVEVMVSWGVPRPEALLCFAHLDKDHGSTISREEFYSDYEPIWLYQVDRMK